MSTERLQDLEKRRKQAELEYARVSGKAEALKAEMVETLERLKDHGVSSVAEAQSRIEELQERSDKYIEKAYSVLDKVQDK